MNFCPASRTAGLARRHGTMRRGTMTARSPGGATAHASSVPGGPGEPAIVRAMSVGHPLDPSPAELRPRDLLAQIHVVLVEPQGPRNVGSVARAMRNFGLGHLRLVKGPPLDHPETLEMGVKAGEILRRAHQVETLPAALEGLTCVIGTTAKRRYRLPTLRPKEAAQRILKEAARGQVGLLFGREDHGLDGSELRLAHDVVAIETAPECRALNISQAVLLLAYEIWLASGACGVVATSPPGRLLTGEMRDLLKEELLDALAATGLSHGGNAIAMRQTMERLLALGPMQTRDARVLFAFARRVRQLAASRLPSDGSQG